MNKLFRKEVIIGLCAIAALAFLFFGIDYLKGVNVFKAANYYYATYTNVNGLAVSAPVTVNGFKVGQVREIEYEYDNPGHVKVEISLDRQLKVPRGTVAVLTCDMLGTASITLEMSGQTDYHNVGDELAASVPAGLLDNVTNDILPTVASIAPKIDSLITALNAIVGDPALLNSVRRLDAITGNLETSAVALNRSMAAMPAVMGNVNAMSQNAVSLTGKLDNLATTLNNAPLDSTINNLYATTQSLRQLSEQLNNPNSTLGKLMNDPSVYNNINAAISDLDSILVDLKRQPKRYIPPIKIF
jgi:phospholipid/cholesterol/gamma-HCH transport system substrate-binding protein